LGNAKNNLHFKGDETIDIHGKECIYNATKVSNFCLLSKIIDVSVGNNEMRIFLIMA